MPCRIGLTAAVLVIFITLASVSGQQAPAAAPAAQSPAPQGKPAAQPPGAEVAADLAKGATLFVVPYAHLDTEWRWDYPTTIREYLPKTIRENFLLHEKYPHYVFNFSGANRYRMIKEYYPADYDKVKQAIADGWWFASGSSMEENDVNAPSAESIVRQLLYGTQYFTREFGRTSAEYMLPDCFGFPASLPSILSHAGIKYFSTQKLSASWQPAAKVGGPDSVEKTPDGIPFNVGVWEGPDGASIVAALNPGSYSQSVTYDLTRTPPAPPAAAPGQRAPAPLVNWPARIALNGQVTGLFADYMYYGTGDTGGSPTEASVRLMEALLTKGRIPLPDPFAARGVAAPAASPQETRVGDGPVRVVQGTAEQMFRQITPEQWARLPRYAGDLELINHSAGSITSQAYVKKWNRENEVLADAAEKASVAAAWLGGRPYPLDRLNDAWTLVMGAQFHDIIPGTSIPKAYEYAWNDQLLALNQFRGVLASAAEAVASALNTQAAGTPVVVFNPLNVPREDLVELTVPLPGGKGVSVRVAGPDGAQVPAQVTPSGQVLFLAKVPSIGFAVFDVQVVDASQAQAAQPAAETRARRPAARSPRPAAPALRVTEDTLENARYTVTIDASGDIGSVFDKQLKRELLAAPARLEIKTDNPRNWPAWNMDWEDQTRPPRAYVGGPPQIRIVERGPARVAVEITRQTEGSTFVQTVRLAAGDAGNRVEVANAVEWNTREAHLKAVFPLTASNAKATYNWDIGTIERPTNHERQFEVASHQWFDLTDRSGAFGVTVLPDWKIASDKPNDNTLRLTLIRTPGTRGGYEDQGSQDIGHHEFVYGIAGHAGDWRQGRTDWQGQRLDTPLQAFVTTGHPGSLGKTFGLLGVSDPRVRVLALKRAERSDEVIVRAVELDGRPAKGVRFTFGVPLAGAREVNGVEGPVGGLPVVKGDLVADFTPYQVRSFALKLGIAPAKAVAPDWQAVALPYDQAVASTDRSVSGGRFDSAGRSLPAEMLPRTLAYAGIGFTLAPPGSRNAVVARGQTVSVPAGSFRRLHLLAAAEGDQHASFHVGTTPVDLDIQDWAGYIGQWDNRVWRSREEPIPARAGQPPPSPATSPRTRTVTEFTGTLVRGYVKSAPVAWFASHRHGTDGSNEPYAYAYLYAYTLDIPAGATTFTLPANERVKVLAASVER